MNVAIMIETTMIHGLAEESHSACKASISCSAVLTEPIQVPAVIKRRTLEAGSMLPPKQTVRRAPLPKLNCVRPTHIVRCPAEFRRVCPVSLSAVDTPPSRIFIMNDQVVSIIYFKVIDEIEPCDRQGKRI
jgi:hypothetical protein